MSDSPRELSGESSLEHVYEGWGGYQTSLVNAITPLTPDQLDWRPSDNHRSVGEIARHISAGRINWFTFMSAPGSEEVARLVGQWETDGDENQFAVEDALTVTNESGGLVTWLEDTWRMIGETLSAWRIADLPKTYGHKWNGSTYANSRQWTIWRIMAHDIHHGGEISLMLGLQGIETFELSALGGHIVLPSPADEPSAKG